MSKEAAAALAVALQSNTDLSRGTASIHMHIVRLWCCWDLSWKWLEGHADFYEVQLAYIIVPFLN
jgi:hypothetical protein